MQTPPRPPQPPAGIEQQPPRPKRASHSADAGPRDIGDLVFVSKPTRPSVPTTPPPAEANPGQLPAQAKPPRPVASPPTTTTTASPPVAPTSPVITTNRTSRADSATGTAALQQPEATDDGRELPRKRTYNFDADVDDALHRISLLTPGPKGDKTYLVNTALREFLLKHPQAMTPVDEELMKRRAGRRHH